MAVLNYGGRGCSSLHFLFLVKHPMITVSLCCFCVRYKLFSTILFWDCICLTVPVHLSFVPVLVYLRLNSEHVCRNLYLSVCACTCLSVPVPVSLCLCFSSCAYSCMSVPALVYMCLYLSFCACTYLLCLYLSSVPVLVFLRLNLSICAFTCLCVPVLIFCACTCLSAP